MTQNTLGNYWIAKPDLIASLICDRVAVDILLEIEGASLETRGKIADLLRARIDQVKESKVNVPDPDQEPLGG